MTVGDTKEKTNVRKKEAWSNEAALEEPAEALEEPAETNGKKKRLGRTKRKYRNA